MPTSSFRLFAQACLGVVGGVLLAVAIARLAFPADGRPTAVPDGLLSWTLPNIWLKPREKGFYLLALALGGMFGYFATYRLLPGRITTRNLWLSLIVSVALGVPSTLRKALCRAFAACGESSTASIVKLANHNIRIGSDQIGRLRQRIGLETINSN